MSRSGYDEADENWGFIRWRGAVSSATKGRRGQAFFKELLGALDAMQEKNLIANEFEADGSFCVLGVLGKKRGINIDDIDPEQVSEKFDIASALAKEVFFMNDEFCFNTETPEQRWTRMRNWVEKQIKEE